MTDISFKKFCEVLEEISETRKRLEIQDILSQYFQNIKENQEALISSCYLSTCTFCPEFLGLELGIGESVILKLVCEITGKKTASVRAIYRKTGDLAEIAFKNRRQALLPQNMDHSIISVKKHLEEIALMAGQDSSANKIRAMCQFCMRCSNLELKYLIRMYESKLKIGLALKTVLISLSLAFFPKDPEYFDKVKSAYNQCPVFEDIIEKLCLGVDISEAVHIRPGIPVKPMLAQASKNLTAAFKKVENTEFVCEYKYDGERAQIHFYGDSTDPHQILRKGDRSQSQLDQRPSKSIKITSNSILTFSKRTKRSDICDLDRGRGSCVDDQNKGSHIVQAVHGDVTRSEIENAGNLLPLLSTEDFSKCMDIKPSTGTSYNLGKTPSQEPEGDKFKNEDPLFLPQKLVSVQQTSLNIDILCSGKKNDLNDSHHLNEKSNVPTVISNDSRETGNLNSKTANISIFKIFSRNSEDITVKYPDLSEVISKMSADQKSFILDSEIVAYNRQTNKILPFQLLTTRKRKNVKIEDITFDVCIFVFDCLFFNGQSLLEQPLCQRRKILSDNFNFKNGYFQIVNHKECSSVEQIDDFFNDAILKNAEGIMVKNIQGFYKPSLRSTSWIKLKKDYLEGMADSFDLVVVGAYYGKGKRTGTFGGFLLACYNEADDEYETICKIGTGFDDESLVKFYNLFSQEILVSVEGCHPSIIYSDSVKPDVWFAPKFVWEVKAAGLSLSPVYSAASKIASSGLSLRFPRFVRERPDKGSSDATTSQQIYDIFNDYQTKGDECSDDFN